MIDNTLISFIFSGIFKWRIDEARKHLFISEKKSVGMEMMKKSFYSSFYKKNLYLYKVTDKKISCSAIVVHIFTHYIRSTMRNVLFYFLLFCGINVLAQNGITFKVEELTPPEKLLSTQSYEQIYEELILSDARLYPIDIQKHNIQFPFEIVAKSTASDSLVSIGYNSFFNGMYYAYAEHRPFVLSPDMIWLLISQGFSRHVNINKENLRKHLVDFSGTQSLIVSSDKKLTDPSLSWEKLFHNSSDR